MKILWQFAGRLYLFFCRRKWIFQSIVVAVCVIQFVLVIALLVQLNALRSEFNAYRNAALRMENQIYSQTYMVNTRVNEVLEKIKK